MVIVADTATYDTTAVNGKLLNIALFCFERIAWVTEIVATGGITLQCFIFNEKSTIIDDFYLSYLFTEGFIWKQMHGMIIW